MKHKLSYLLATVAALVTALSAMAQTTYYVLEESGPITLTTSITSVNGVQSSPIKVDGPGIAISLKLSKNRSTGINNNVYIEKSTDNGNSWTDLLNFPKDDFSTTETTKKYDIDLDSQVTHIRFNARTGCTYARTFKDIKITRATTLTSSTTELDFGTTDPGTPVTRTISVDFNNTYSDAVLTGSCTNNAFTITEKRMVEKGTAEEITITYKPSKAGTDTGRVTLSMGSTADKNNKVTYSFDVTGRSRLNLYPSNTGSYQSGSMPEVVLHRTLPAGYSTIALPFDTSIGQINGNGNDDKVFTLCNVSYSEAKGYTFYFTEVEGGSISAGQPYVIFLNTQVINPLWKNVTCSELAPVVKDLGAWDFVSNFQANTSMSGKYGVVNSRGKIMKGGANATLNAYTAYFQLNTQTKSSAQDNTIPANAIPLFTIKE